jgi:hypothetical protein
MDERRKELPTRMYSVKKEDLLGGLVKHLMLGKI